MLNVLKQYAVDVLSGKIKIRDVPSRFRSKVMEMIKTNNFTNTPIDEKLNTIIGYADKLKKGEITRNDIPDNYKHGVDEMIEGKAPLIGMPNPRWSSRRYMKSRINRLLRHYEKRNSAPTPKDMIKMSTMRFVESHPDLFKNPSFRPITSESRIYKQLHAIA